MSKTTHIFQDEILLDVLRTNKEFVISCKDKNEQQSKAVGLINARRKLSPDSQRKLRIQKTTINEALYVKVSPSANDQVFEIVNGELVPYNREDHKLSDDSLRQIKYMLEAGLPESEILSALSEDNEELVIKSIEEAKLNLKEL